MMLTPRLKLAKQTPITPLKGGIATPVLRKGLIGVAISAIFVLFVACGAGEILEDQPFVACGADETLEYQPEQGEIIPSTPLPTPAHEPESTEENLNEESINEENINEESINEENINENIENSQQTITAPYDECFAFEYWLSSLTIEERIGQLFMLRLPWQTQSVNERVRNLFDAVPMGGVILFGDNVDSISQVQALIAGLQEISRIPLIISIDEEGGRVSRVGRIFSREDDARLTGISPYTVDDYDIGSREDRIRGMFGGPLPAAYEIGQGPGWFYAYEAAWLNALRLQSLGITMNFAPVADVWSNPDNAVIGNRAFGRDGGVVAALVDATVQGLYSQGIMSVIKHFPGHGDTYEDSHYLLAIHHHGKERWLEAEALPFISGITAGADGVMVGHIATPAIGGHTVLLDWMQPWVDSGDLPATFSDFWLQYVLRGRLGFDGLIITDALEMRALTDNFTCGQIALGAFLAGADILLMPHNSQEAFNAVLHAYREGIFDEERLNQSLLRIFNAKPPTRQA